MEIADPVDDLWRSNGSLSGFHAFFVVENASSSLKFIHKIGDSVMADLRLILVLRRMELVEDSPPL